MHKFILEYSVYKDHVTNKVILEITISLMYFLLFRVFRARLYF